MNSAIFVDLETGGLGPDHPIIQLAAVAVDLSSWKELEVYEAKLRFDPAVCEPQALAVNGYTAEQWAAAIEEPQLVQELLQLLNRHTCVQLTSKRTGRPYSVARLAGHNIARFDTERISRAFGRQKVVFPVHFAGPLDTLHAASWFFALQPDLPKPPDYTLSGLAKYFGIPAEGAHDALVDVRITVALAQKLHTFRGVGA
jgi:DNA polymerase III epsilon subunit-like protein